MKKSIAMICAFVLLSGTSARAQHHTSNWVHRAATDTTVVPCWTDSLTTVAFPPNSMNMMMMPDPMYMRIDRMSLDSLSIPHDSTFIGWCRIQAGRDSMRFDLMNGDSVYGGRSMMQFMLNLQCELHWDSLMSDSSHKRWQLSGVKAWSGAGWTGVPGVTIAGNSARFASSQIYSVVAFVGAPGAVAALTDQQVTPGAFTLEQNYPNPFNPSTTIVYGLPQRSAVSLTVYNTLGQRVATLFQGEQGEGYHEVRFDATSLSSGVYFCRLTAGSFIETRRLLLVR